MSTLNNAKFIRANLGGASFERAIFNENTDFSFARLRGARAINLIELKKTILVGTEMPDGTINES